MLTFRMSRIRFMSVVAMVMALLPLISNGSPSAAATSPPTVSGLSVHSGWYGGGTRVTVHGSHFVHVLRVKFGTVTGKSLHVVSPTTLRVTTPAHSAGRTDVRVVTATGTSPVVTKDRFRFAGWALTKIPLPPHSDGYTRTGTLERVACWKQDGCAAAGTYRETSGDSQGALYRLSGRVWSVVKAPLPADAADNPGPVPTQISCGTSGVCAVTGSYRAHVNGSDSTRELIWTLSAAGQWTRSLLPLPAGVTSGSADLNPLTTQPAISCGGSQCAAIGDYSDGSKNRVVLWTMTGGTWTATWAPVPADAKGDPTVQVGAIVACESSGTCAAMGTYSTQGGAAGGALWRWTGTRWIVTEAPPPANTLGFGYTQTPLSCGTGGLCAGVLAPESSTLPQQLWTVSGDHWSRVTLPLPGGADASKFVGVTAVSCASRGLCAAAGTYTDTNGNSQASLWSRSSDGSWTAKKAPLPTNAAANPTAAPKAMSCGDSGVCVVNGVYTAHRDGSDEDDGILWQFSANAWSRVTGIDLRFVSVQPRVGIACNSRFCVVNVDRYTRTLYGGTWRTTALARPSDASEEPAGGYTVASPSFAGGALRTYYYGEDSRTGDAVWVYIS